MNAANGRLSVVEIRRSNPSIQRSLMPLCNFCNRFGPIVRRGAAWGALCGLLMGLLGKTALMRGLDDLLFDGVIVWRGQRTSAAKDRVVLIDVDDDTLAYINKPNAYISPELAEAIDYLHLKQAKAIGVDLYLSDDLNRLPELERNRTGDATKMGVAVNKAGNVVLADLKTADRVASPPLREWWSLKAANQPQPTDLAFVNLTEDGDNFVRRQQLWSHDRGEQQLQFALALDCLATDATAEVRDGQLSVGGRRIPLDSEHRLRINFVGGPGAFTVYSLEKILRQARGEEAARLDFRDAIVLIGSIRGTQDVHATPYANRLFNIGGYAHNQLMPGTEIQAHLLATLYDQAFIGELPSWATLLLAVMLGAAWGAALAKMNVWWGLLLTIVAHVCWKAICVLTFIQFDLRLNLGVILATGALAYAASFVARWRQVQRLLRASRSSAVAVALEASGTSELAGEERVVTVLFADIRGFTTWSSTHTSTQVFRFLNAYFGQIVPLIESRGGVLTQYIGDGVMVIFNAPLRVPEHRRVAVDTAAALIDVVRKSGPLWAAHDFQNMKIGVGVATGNVTVGTVGIPTRLDYTALGDVTNSAARIEGENKEQQTEILIDDETRKELTASNGQLWQCETTPRLVELRGRNQISRLFQVTIDR